MDDADEILRRCRDGRDAECAAMVRCFQPRVYRLALRVTGDPARAEEAAAAALVKIWTGAKGWRGESSARAWVDRVAVRAVLDAVRGERRWWRRWSNSSAADTADPRAGAAESTEREEELERTAARIRKAVAELEPADRALVHLYYFEDRGLAELEAIFSVGRDALKMRLSRARQKLKGILGTDDHAD